MSSRAENGRWVDSTAGVIVINGVITAVVSALVTWILNNAETLPWGSIFITFGIAAAGMFLLLSLFRRSLRDLIWRRPARWLWSMRPVTHRRYKRDLSDVLTVVEDDVKKVKASLAEYETSLSAVTTVVAALTKASEEKPSGFDTEWGGTNTFVPRPDPRWELSIGSTDYRGFTTYTIKNQIPGSIATQVRFDPDIGLLSFDDAAYFADLNGPASGECKIRIDSTDDDGNARFKMTYRDEFNEIQKQFFWARPQDPNTWEF